MSNVQEPALPVKSIVLFISFGTMTFLLIFLFAKRQITRFALKSSRGPHVPIGSGVPKVMKRDLERKLERTLDIKYEPLLLTEGSARTASTYFRSGETCHYLLRMKALDGVHRISKLLAERGDSFKQKPKQTVPNLLYELRQVDSPLCGFPLDSLRKFSALYSHARHDPKEFTRSNYEEYKKLLNKIISYIKSSRSDDLDIGCSSHSSTMQSQKECSSHSSTMRSHSSSVRDSEHDSGVQITYRPPRNMDAQQGHVLLHARESSMSSTEATTAAKGESTC